jgi:hypothetical protein
MMGSGWGAGACGSEGCGCEAGWEVEDASGVAALGASSPSFATGSWFGCGGDGSGADGGC